MALHDVIHDNKKFIRLIINGIKTKCNATKIIEYIKQWKKDYEKQGYKFMSRENINKSVVKILNKKLK